MNIEPIHTVAPESTDDSFYGGALQRIQRAMLALLIGVGVGAFLIFDWRIGVGFICGGAISYLNFLWLGRVVESLAERITQGQKARSRRGTVARFVFRYLLMALAAYAIFSFSPASLNGLFAGLFLPVAGIACEAGYELYAAVARGA